MKVQLNQEIQARLAGCISRLYTATKQPALFGGGMVDGKFVKWSDHISGKFQKMRDSLVDADLLAKTIERGLRGDTEAQTQLNGLRIETANNYIQASANFLPYFEAVTLADDERPVYQNETMQSVRVGYLPEDGGPQRTKVIKPQNETQIDLRYLATDDVWYRVTDIYRGDVSRSAQATFDLGLDMRLQMDLNAFTLLTASVANGGAFGTFDFSNANKATHVFKPHPNIRLANLPTTNDLTAKGTAADSPFRFEVFDAVVKYCAQWADSFRDGPLKPLGDIVVPSNDIDGFSELIQPTGNQRNSVADQVMEQGWATIDYLGTMWRLIPDNTIEPGVCYPRLSKPVGRLYLKPSQDADIVNSDKEQIRKNIESRFLRKVFGIYIPTDKRINVCRVRYRNAA